MKRHIIFILALLLVGSVSGRAGEVTVGLLSFDQFIPASGTTPGVNAFDIYNFTGSTWGSFAGLPYASDPLSFTNATLTVEYELACTTVICPHVVVVFPKTVNLGDIAPGELLDSSGNPIAQFPSTDLFLSATLTATLTPATFQLSDGTTFTAGGSITANLTAPPNHFLVAGTDFAPINAQPAQITPEPSPLVELIVGLIALSAFWLCKRKNFQFR